MKPINPSLDTNRSKIDENLRILMDNIAFDIHLHLVKCNDLDVILDNLYQYIHNRFYDFIYQKLQQWDLKNLKLKIESFILDIIQKISAM